MSELRLNSYRCLLLNADLIPLRIISWQRAMIWSLKYANNSNYGIEIIDYYPDIFIHGTNNKRYRVPAVAKTVKFFNVYKKIVNITNKNLFIRDDHTCQYCGIKYPINQLTRDHIVPRSRYRNERSISGWDNLITSCYRCNAKKGNKTPEEAGMKLLNKPYIPVYSKKYLPWMVDLSIIDNDPKYSLWKPFISVQP